MANIKMPILFQGASAGISDSKFSGIAGSFQEIENLEIRKEPKSITLQKAMLKDSGSVVVDLINCVVTISSTGDIVAFGDAGNIYVKGLGGAWQKVYTHSSGYSILGCAEYNQYIYRATLDKLHRTDITSIATAISTGTLTPTDLNRKTLNGITYSNGLTTSYTLDTSTKAKVGMKIYAKKNYSLTAVGVSDGTIAATKGYLEEAPAVASIAGNTLRLYTSAQIDPLTGTPTWTERRPLGDNNKDWRMTGASADGLKMIAGAVDEVPYYSTDAGVNWTAMAVNSGSTETLSTTGGSGTSTTTQHRYGVQISVTNSCKITTVVTAGSAGITDVRIVDGVGTVLKQTTYSGTTATFNINIVKGGTYYIENYYPFGAGTLVYGMSTPSGTNISIVGGAYDGGPLGNTYEIRDINVVASDLVDFETGSVSSSGSVMTMAQKYGLMYQTTDSGANWSEITPAGATARAWRISKVSGDGTKYLAGAYGKRLFTSSNGTAWTEQQPAGNADKNRISGCINYTGDKLLVASYGGRIWYGSGYGALRVERRPLGDSDQNRTCVSQSDNGATVIAAVGSDVYYSNDYGTTFATQSLTDAISSVQCDYNGVILTASTAKRCYQSLDGGTTWTQLQPAGNNDKIRNNLSISAGAIPLEKVSIAANVATFSSSLVAGKYYYITFDKESDTRDPSYKAMALPLAKSDINYITGVIPYKDTSNARVITSIGASIVNDIAHPMLTSNGTLYIGDGNFVATVDLFSTYTSALLTLPELDKVFDMSYNNSYLRLYCSNGINIDSGMVYFWDGVSDFIDVKQPLPGKFKCSTIKGNVDYVIIGDDPILYYYPFQYQPLKRIPHLSSGVKNMIVYKNYLLFGASGGIYSYGAYNKDYPEVLNYEYKTSNGNSTDTMGCIWNSNGNLYCAWKNGSNYGIDMLSSSYAKLGHCKTKVYLGNEAWHVKSSKQLNITHVPLVTGQQINIYTQTDMKGTDNLRFTLDTTTTTGNFTRRVITDNWQELEVKLELVGDGTNTPEVIECILQLSEQDDGS